MSCSALRGALALGVTAVLSVATLPASAAGAMRVTVDGRPVTLAPAPIVRAGRLFVPLRGIFEDVGASVVFANGQINATGNGHTVSLHLGSRQAFVDGQQEMLDAAPFLVGTSLYIPLRFVSQALGTLVDYDPRNELVAIATGNAEAPNQSITASPAASPAPAVAAAPPSPTPPSTIPQRVASAPTASPPVAAVPASPMPSPTVPQRVASAATAPPTPAALRQPTPMPSAKRVASAMTVPRTPAVPHRETPRPRRTRRPASSVRLVLEHPANGTSVRSSRPTVQASFERGKVNPNRVRVTLDGRDVTVAAYVSAHGITYTPLSPIPPGMHDVRVHGADESGATFLGRWRFRSGSEAPMVTIANVAPRPGGTVGREFTVRGRTTPGATVTIQVNQTSRRRSFGQILGGLFGIGRPAAAQSTVTAGRNGRFVSLIDINAPRGVTLGIVITSTDSNYGIVATPMRFSVRMQ
jgi:hypothetical protein